MKLSVLYGKITLIPVFGIAICCYGLLSYALLYPSTGTGTIDRTLYGSLEKTDIFFLLIIMQILNCFFIISTPQLYRYFTDVMLSTLLILFSIVIVLQALRPTPILYSLINANICTGIMVFFMTIWLKTRTRLSYFFPAALFAVFGFYALVILKILYFSGKTQHNGIFFFHDITRLSIIFDNPNHLGNMLAFGVVSCFASVTLTSKRRVTILLWSILSLLMLGLIQTYSRGAWFGCVVGIFTAVVYLKKYLQRSKLYISLAILLAITMLSFLAAPGGHTTVFSRAACALPSSDAAVGHRLEVWKSAVKMIRDHLSIGVGVGQFGEELDKGYKPASLVNLKYASAMNNYLTLAAEAGLPTALFYILCLVLVCTLASKRLPKEGFGAGINIGMLCGVYSMLIFAYTTYSLGRVYAIILVWSVLGYLVAERVSHE